MQKKIPIDITAFELEGHISSVDLVEKIAIFHRRKAHVNKQKYEHDAILSDLQPDDAERKTHAKIVRGCIKELSEINSRLNEFSIMYRNSIDQLVLEELRKHDAKLHELLVSKAKIVYSQKHHKK